jgi:hypothetical protein
MSGLRRFFSNVSGRDLSGLLRFFASEGTTDRSGFIAPIFALMLLPVAVLAAGTMEMAGWLNARQKTIAALDAGLLAGGRVLMLRGLETEAISAAKGVYEENVKTRSGAVSDKISFKAEGSDAFAVAGNVQYQTKLLSLIGISELPLLKEDGSENPISKYSILTDALEISLVLDVSGSMQDSLNGIRKIDTLKAAATELVGVLLDSEPSTSAQNKVPARVAVVPFASGVRPPESLFKLVRNPEIKGPYHKGSTSLSDSLPPSTKWWDYFNNLFLAYPCVVERTGPDKYTDAIGGPGAYSMPLVDAPDWKQVFVTGAAVLRDDLCPRKDMAVLPLSSDYDQVSSAISRLEPTGLTAGHVGVAWGWYMLSPEWAPLLTAAEPAAYQPTTRKVVIFLTDGQNNGTAHSIYGVRSLGNNSATNPNPKPDTAANGASPNTQQLALCENMKQANVEIFTVGFGLWNGPALELLETCATSSNHFYKAEDSESLYQVFDSIRRQLGLLYIAR